MAGAMQRMQGPVVGGLAGCKVELSSRAEAFFRPAAQSEQPAQCHLLRIAVQVHSTLALGLMGFLRWERSACSFVWALCVFVLEILQVRASTSPGALGWRSYLTDLAGRLCGVFFGGLSVLPFRYGSADMVWAAYLKELHHAQSPKPLGCHVACIGNAFRLWGNLKVHRIGA